MWLSSMTKLAAAIHAQTRMTVEAAKTQENVFHCAEGPSHLTQKSNVAMEMEPKNRLKTAIIGRFHCRHSNVAKLESNVSSALPRGVLN